MKKILTMLFNPGRRLATIFLVIIIIALVTMGYLGHLTPIISFLDSDILVFHIGEIRFSAYLILKAI
jgi:quinol-cytochrome oxidoreductase complex cytochrome b subunit